MPFLRKAASWWGLENLGKLADITFKLGAVVAALIAANSLLVRANVKVTEVTRVEYRIDEQSVRTFYRYNAVSKRPPNAIILLIRQVNYATPDTPSEPLFSILPNPRCFYQQPFPNVSSGKIRVIHSAPLRWGGVFTEPSCSSLLEYMAEAAFDFEEDRRRVRVPRYSLQLAHDALRASVYGEVEVELTNTGLGTAKEVVVTGPTGVQEAEKLVTLERDKPTRRLLEVRGDGKRPLGLLDQSPTSEDFSVAWRSEASDRTRLITVIVAAGLFLIVALTVLAEIRRTPIEPAGHEVEGPNDNH